MGFLSIINEGLATTRSDVVVAGLLCKKLYRNSDLVTTSDCEILYSHILKIEEDLACLEECIFGEPSLEEYFFEESSLEYTRNIETL